MPRDFPVPAALTDRLAAWLADGSPAGPPPRPAATVVLVRPRADGDDPLEVFVMRRRTTMAFAAGMVVFPGGGVDERDGSADVPWSGPDADWWATATGTDVDRVRATVCAAVRETFEECGLLLASSADRAGTDDVVDADEWSDHERARLESREVALSALLAERGLVLRADLLLPLAHWTTPEFEPRRYDTWLLLARLPSGRAARHVSTEASSAGWTTPRSLLAGAATGEVGLLPPTRVVVEQLAAAGGVDELWASVGAQRGFPEVMPVPVADGGTLVLRTDLDAPGERA